MGRTFEILKQAETAHFSSEKTVAGSVSNLADLSATAAANFAEAIPYVEVGGPGSAMEGSPDVLSGFGSLGQSRASASGVRRETTLPLHRIPHPQTSELPDFHPVSVAFRPLDSLYSLEGKSDRVAAEIIALHQPDHPVSKEYETLAEAIGAQLPMGGSHVLMFMGAGSGFATTTVVLNLAFTWARPKHQRIVVVDAGAVDAGISQGSVAQKLGLPASPLPLPPASPGREARDSGPELSELQETKWANLFVLCSGNHSFDSGRTSPAQANRDILRRLRKQFDLILIDAPPPPPTGEGGHGCWDMAALASGCDGVYLVVPESAVKTPEIDELLKAIQGQGIPLGGCVLTSKRRG